MAAIALVCGACGAGHAAAITVGAVGSPTGAGAEFRPPADAVTLRGGPGPVRAHTVVAGYRVEIAVRPNRTGRSNTAVVTLLHAGRAVHGARVRLEAGMLAMAMGVADYRLAGANSYRAALPAWLMPGEWGLGLTVTPPGRRPIHVVLDDRMRR